MSALTLTIPPALWLTSNRPIKVHAHKARIVRGLHELAWFEARRQRLGRDGRLNGPMHAHWTIAYPKGVGWTHGDAANAHPTCKALLDGLVPIWLPGDGPRHIVAETYRRGPNLDVPSLHGVVLELTQEER